MKKLIYIAALCIFAQGCKIDEDLTPLCGEPGGWGHATVISPEGKPFRNAPSSNPLNSNEFAYIADDSSIEGYWKYNMLTNTKSLIVEMDAWEPADWSIKDWIVFGSNAQIFVCKSNGDSLKQLTFEYENYDPSWSPDGNLIIFRRNQGDAIANFTVVDMTGSIIQEYKSTVYAGTTPSWSPDGRKIAFVSTSNTYNKYLVAYFIIDQPEVIHYLSKSSVTDGGSVGGILDWYSDSKNIIYSINGEIYTINVESGLTVQIKDRANCMRYSYHTLLADGQTIISVKSESTYDAETNTEYHEFDLIKIMPDGSEIVIPY